MIGSEPVEPGEAAAFGSCLTMNVYVVFCASTPDSQVASAEVHALPATKTNFEVHDLSVASISTL
jgi:hypothetical protein